MAGDGAGREQLDRVQFGEIGDQQLVQALRERGARRVWRQALERNYGDGSVVRVVPQKPGWSIKLAVAPEPDGEGEAHRGRPLPTSTSLALWGSRHWFGWCGRV